MAIPGYKVLVKTVSAKINPDEILVVEVPCPRNKVILGGGAECQALPPGSAANYTLRSSFPVTDGNARKWMAVWTNATNVNHPQVVQFTTCLICANK